jgi:hypothetical protein
VPSNRDLEAYANYAHAGGVALLAIAAELRMHPADLVAEARERPARVGALYDSLARERARRFGKDRQVGIEPDPTQPANAER